MLTELHIKNWKSFEEASLYIDPLTVLVGLNASGKSNIVDILKFLERSVKVSLSDAISQEPEIRGGIDWVCLKNHDFIVVKLQFENNGEKFGYELTINIRENGSSTKKALLGAEKLYKFEHTKASIKYTEFYWTDPIGADTDDFVIARFKHRRGTPLRLHRQSSVLQQTTSMDLKDDIKSVSNYLRTFLHNIFILDPIPANMRNYARLEDRLMQDGSNISGVIAGLPQAERQLVESSLTEHVGNLPDNPFKRIYTEQIGKFKQDAMLYGTERIGNQNEVDVDARSMSDGTLRIIAIITAILTRPKGSLLVIEEVDNGLFPSKAGVLLNILHKLGAQRGIDILITTHNPAMIDSLEKTFLPFIFLVFRNEINGYSSIKPIEDLSILPKLMGYSSLGQILTQNLIDKSNLTES